MWVRFGNKSVDVNGIVIDSSTSTVWVSQAGCDRKLKAGQYVNTKRAKEVFDGFWMAIRVGETGYEIPDV